MKVLFVRHAQSTNNSVQTKVQSKLDGGTNLPEAQAAWLTMRHEDPPLSDVGRQQLAAVAKHTQKLAKRTGCAKGKYKVITSPMQRACETTEAVISGMVAGGLLDANAAKASVEVSPEWAEIGGVFRTEQQTDNSFMKKPGNAPEARALKQKFGYNVDNLPTQGPWDGARGYESTAQAIHRAERAARWLRTQAAASVSNDGCLVIVSHADFLALVMAALYHAPMNADSLSNNPDLMLSGGSRGSGATGASSLRSGTVDGGFKRVPSNWSGVSQGQAEGTLAISLSENMDAVYAKFCMSVACTTLLQISDSGQISVVWFNKKSHLIKSNCIIS
eukprot:Tamp_19793.p1 GENE.Tamp_19793~~Tamp_19793.p1  ORF type:complete len:332 (+),score=64.61 Tamp_19793:1-996(+)